MQQLAICETYLYMDDMVFIACICLLQLLQHFELYQGLVMEPLLVANDFDGPEAVAFEVVDLDHLHHM
jgi:hypothetical protein